MLARLPDGAAIVVGCSGGLDSTVLLHALADGAVRSGRGLRAVHVHHGLHPDADAWTAHCQRFCDYLGVPLTIAHVAVERSSGEGLEGAARSARHAAFEADLRDGEALALAHHRGDQAETFLLRALRASGPDGLGAMRPLRRFGRGWLWRPLLAVPRSELLAYAQRHELRWVDDPSNADTELDRNFLRHRILPLLQERWPHAEAVLARSAALSAQAGDLLADSDASALAMVRRVDPQVIDVMALLALPAARRARVLRRWIGELGLPPLPAEGIDRIERDLLRATPGAGAAFLWSRTMIRRWRDLLHADRQRSPLPSDWRCAWDGATPLSLPDGSWLRLERTVGFDHPLVVHARQGGERITLPGRRHSHALKHVLQELGVPPWVRERLPLLSDVDGELLAAGDLVHSARFDQWQRERGASLVWLGG